MNSCSYLLIQPHGTQVPVPHGDPWTSALRSQFHIHIITQGQLTALYQVGAWGDVEKPNQDMAFLLIAPNLAVGCEWVFRLTAVWMHLCQAHLPVLVDAAQKLLLLVDEGTDWTYAYTRMNDAVVQALLSSVGNIGVMTGDLLSQNTCSHLHQIHMWKLLQCRGCVVFPDGLNEDWNPLCSTLRS